MAKLRRRQRYHVLRSPSEVPDILGKIRSKTQLNHCGVFNNYVMETTTCFDLYWPSSGCLEDLRASYMHARARGVEISTYA